MLKDKRIQMSTKNNVKKIFMKSLNRILILKFLNNFY